MPPWTNPTIAGGGTMRFGTGDIPNRGTGPGITSTMIHMIAIGCFSVCKCVKYTLLPLQTMTQPLAATAKNMQQDADQGSNAADHTNLE